MPIIDDIRERGIGANVAVFLDDEPLVSGASTLASMDVYQKLLRTVADPIYTTELIRAERLRSKLDDMLKHSRELDYSGKELRELYSKLLEYLKFVTLPLRSLDEVEELFSHHLLLAFEYGGFMLKDKVELIFLYHDFRLEISNQYTQALLRGLKLNQESLGSKNLALDDNQNVESIISNWLKDYDHFSAHPSNRTALNVVTYLNQSRNVRLLDKEKREILHSILSLYDYLRNPLERKISLNTGLGTTVRHSLPAEPLAPPEVETGVAPQKATVQSKVTAEVIQAYEGDPKQKKAIDREYDQLLKKFANDLKGLHNEFMASVQRKNVSRVIALLQIFSEQNDLAKFMAEDEKLGPFLAALWQKRYTKEFVDAFKQQPDQPRYVRTFLQYVLEERLELSVSDAARVGVHIGNIFVKAGNKSYNKLAYFDIKDKQFKWFED